MLIRLLLLFTLVPLLELFLLLKLTEWWDSAWYTFLLVIATGVVGAALARWQGIRTWQRFHRDLAEGRLPADALVDGMLIFLAGGLLLTPGILTDLVGFALLLPPVRAILKSRLRKRFQADFTGQSHVYTWRNTPPRQDTIIESRLLDEDEKDESR